MLAPAPVVRREATHDRADHYDEEILPTCDRNEAGDGTLLCAAGLHPVARARWPAATARKRRGRSRPYL